MYYFPLLKRLAGYLTRFLGAVLPHAIAALGQMTTEELAALFFTVAVLFLFTQGVRKVGSFIFSLFLFILQGAAGLLFMRLGAHWADVNVPEATTKEASAQIDAYFTYYGLNVTKLFVGKY